MPNINVLIKPSSGMCNLRCSYCFYLDETQKREVASYGFMSEETLEIIIRKAIEFSETECTIAYQGGEPTLRGLEFFEKSIEYQNKYNTKKILIHNAIQTNGYKLSNEFIQFFKDSKFLVGISLDGTEYIHNTFRKNAVQEDTYACIMETIDKLKKAGVEFNVLTVVHAKNAKHISKIYQFYKNNNFDYMQFIPCLNPIGEEATRFIYTLTPKDYGIFLKTLFDVWYQDVKKGNYVHIQQFENYILMLMGRAPDLCGMSGTCSYQNVIEADGEVYPCDFYVLDEYKLGNLNNKSFEDINKRRQEIKFVEESYKKPEECEKCKYFSLCRGGCKRYREPMQDVEYQKNRFCSSYYDFFEYTIERLRELARHYYNQ